MSIEGVPGAVNGNQRDPFYLKYGAHRPYYYKQAIREADPVILSAAQISEACNTKLNITDRDDPLKFNQGNVATGLKHTRGVASVPLSTYPNKTGEHVQGWILVPPSPSTSEQAKRKRLLRQIARYANKLPAWQACEWLEKSWASRPQGAQ